MIVWDGGGGACHVSMYAISGPGQIVFDLF
jgi:hypothetical protein